MRGARDYLTLLGLPEDLPPTLETLRAVQNAHVQRVPYNNLDIMLGKPTSVVGSEAMGHLLATGRSGYCFHQNGVLELALKALGFAVERRHGHVWTQAEHQHQDELNHLVLIVRGLPTPSNPAGDWWPDVGLGDGIWDPLPVAPGQVIHTPFVFLLSDVTPRSWSFLNDPRGSFTGVEVRAEPVDAAAVVEAHRQLSTPPHGAFTKLLVVARRDSVGSHVLRGCVLTRTDETGTAVQDVTSYDDWRDVLLSLRLSVTGISAEELRDLFRRTLRAHHAWDAAGRP